MNPALDDLHGGPPAEAGERFAADTLRGFHALKVRVIVIGGTALRLLGSPVPSIDLDCLIHESDWDRHDVYDFIDERQTKHGSAYADSYLEVEAIEWTNRVWNSDASYSPSDLFQITGSQTIRARLAGKGIDAEIPTLDSLMLMKIKAMGDRGAQLHYAQEPTERASLMPDALETIEHVPAGFYRRKAGKDLVDITVLGQKGGDLQHAARLAETLGIRKAIAQGWTEVQEDLVEESRRLLVRHGLQGEPAKTLDMILEAFSRD